jgi:tRNA(Arg) A34 adenosine deaminase TadA
MILMNKEKILEIMKRAARASTTSTHEVYKMGAVVVKSGRILSAASNRINRGCSLISDKKWKNTLHAEAHAILHLLKKKRLKQLVGSSLYVTRVSRSGQLLNSKPCSFCAALAASVGVKSIYFTDCFGKTKEITL